MVKILFMIISCDNNMFSEKHLWKHVRNKDINNYVILCGKSLDKEYLLNNNILYLNCNDYYEALPEKVLSGIKAILNIHKYNDITHLIKIDFKNFINEISKKTLKKLLEILQNNKYHYMGQIINPRFICSHRSYAMKKSSLESIWKHKQYEGIYPAKWADGESYILSRYALKKVTIYFNKKGIKYIYNNHIHEDVMIALILKKHNILPKKINYNNKSFIRAKIYKYLFNK
jgi:hypothetical protein